MTGNSFVKKWIGSVVTMAIVVTLTACGEVEENTSLATKLIQELDYRGALTELDKALEAGENERVVERSRGIAYMGLTEYENAIEAFRLSLDGSDGMLQDIDFDTNYYLAAAYTKNGQYSEAEDAYNAILDLRSGEKDAYFLRGNVRMHLEKFEAAIEDFDRVISMEPKNYDRLFAIYEVLEYFGYREVGQEYLQKAMTDDPKMTQDVIGRIYYYLGEYQKACLALEEAKSKGDSKSYLFLGRAYEATGDFNYAASVYRSYLSKNEGDAQMLNQLGLCEMARGEYQKALEAFQTGKQLGDTGMLQTLSFNEIVAYEYLGNFEQAHQLMEAYHKNYPDDEGARREYDFLSTR